MAGLLFFLHFLRPLGWGSEQILEQSDLHVYNHAHAPTHTHTQRQFYFCMSDLNPTHRCKTWLYGAKTTFYIFFFIISKLVYKAWQKKKGNKWEYLKWKTWKMRRQMKLVQRRLERRKGRGSEDRRRWRSKRSGAVGKQAREGEEEKKDQRMLNRPYWASLWKTTLGCRL